MKKKIVTSAGQDGKTGVGKKEGVWPSSSRPRRMAMGNSRELGTRGSLVNPDRNGFK